MYCPIYSIRNILRLFTIPLGHLSGGILVDNIFEPFMGSQSETSMISRIFGNVKGFRCGVSVFFIAFWVFWFVLFSKNYHIRDLEK